MRRIIIQCTLVAALSGLSCSQPDGPLGPIVLELLFRSEMQAGMKTLLPDVSLEVTEYLASGIGPGTEVFEVTTTESSCLIEGIVSGMWSISVEGRNAEGVGILYGEAEVELSRENSQASIYLFPFPGAGTLRIDVSWDAQAAVNPVLTASIEDGSGSPHTPEVEQGPDSATVVEELAAGYYKVVLQLHENDTLVGGCAESVYIVADQVTTATIVLDVLKETLDPEIVLHVPPFLPLTPGIIVPLPPVFSGNSSTIYAELPAEAANAEIVWFRNGNPVGIGASFAFEPEWPGNYRLDALVYDDLDVCRGSAHIVVEVVKPVFYGSLLFIRAHKNSDPDIDGISGARNVSISKDGRFAAVAGYSNNQIVVFTSRDVSGDLHQRQTLYDGAHGPLDGVRALAFSADDRFLFAASSRSNSIVWFERDTESGDFVPLAFYPDGGAGAVTLDGASDIAVTEDGDLLFAAAREGSRIAVFRIDSVSSRLELLSTVEAADVPGGQLAAPEHIEITPDGLQAVVSCWTSDSVLVFGIDPVPGALQLEQVFTDGVSGADGLNGPGGLCFSPDGGSMYVAGYYDHAVSLFSRDPETRAWTWVETRTDGENGVGGIRYARDVGINPDGSEVYVCGGGSDALSVFNRDPISGSLSYSAHAENGGDRVAGLDGVRSIDISPDGRVVYTVSSNDSAVALFRRN